MKIREVLFWLGVAAALALAANMYVSMLTGTAE
jgi:hypothetical protein